MAPTLVGPHQVGLCPHCEQEAMVVPCNPDDPRRMAEPREELSICRSCLRTARIRAPRREIRTADRFIGNKLLSSRRWDLVVFRYPADPTIKYVKRLVGLPGETIVIKEGTIWVNGTQLMPPTEIEQLRYDAAPEWAPGETWGSPERPAQLGADEYFVVGDFSLRSADSRTWQNHVDGHSPYAIPHSHMEGVVTLIYWPPARWRIFR
jgi:signal peptidase I